MSYQFVFDNAETISVNRSQQVAQTQSRSGVIKSTSLGYRPWEFTVRLPDGPRYSVYRGLISEMANFDRTVADTVSITQSYISGYQGDLSSTTGITASVTQGEKYFDITNIGSTSGNRFLPGDLVQLGTTGSVYEIIETVGNTEDRVTVHRPIIDSTGSYTLRVGTDVEFTVICAQMPSFTIFGYDQVSWSGEFVFVEVL